MSISRPVARLVRGVLTDEGTEFGVRRTMPQEALPHLDPFALFDEFGPDIPPGNASGYGVHPHAGLEVVSYMLEGEMETGEQEGKTESILQAGDVAWIRFGAGGVHYERPRRSIIEKGGRCHSFQLWLGLSRDKKQLAPKGSIVARQEMPEIAFPDGATVRLLCGALEGRASPVRPETDLFYAHIMAPAATRLCLPMQPDHNAFVYALTDNLIVSAADISLKRGWSAVLSNRGDVLEIGARDGPAEALVLAAKPTGEPIVKRAVFVMNSEDEIEKCFEKYLGALLLGA